MSTKRFNQQTTKDNKAIKKKQKNKIVEEEEEEEEETTTSTTTTTTASPIVYHGELKCQSTTKQCNNKAYFYISTNKSYLCGVHSKTHGTSAKPLPKLSQKDKDQRQLQLFELEKIKVENVRLLNAANGMFGNVRLSPLLMMKSPEQMDGYLKVFPNFKHAGRKDGLGMNTLSPKYLGPVQHNQPNTPEAKNIENFHQGSKCFDLDLESDGSVGKKYKKSRDKMFTDADPHRHKYKDDKGKPLKPKFFVYYDKDGKEHRLGIVQCRQFYCNYYERLVKQQDQFKQLVQLHRTGTNLQIIGYDARHVPSDQASIDKEYLNAFKPFGHELVLFAMLIIQDESNYPWRTNKTFDF